jgi:DNA-binding NarL/FixJ family response regulator
MKPVFFSDDINLLCYWQKSFDAECEIVEDLEYLLQLQSRTIVLNYSACENRSVEVVQLLSQNQNKVLVLHRTPSLKIAKQLLNAGALGYGNALMRDHFIVSALQTIEDGMVWLYPSLTSELILELPVVNKKENSLLKDLTSREQEVAQHLKDGEIYKKIAEKLNITPRTVKAHASNIYAKLNVKDRLGLALLLK